jgi:hypothetical protein
MKENDVTRKSIIDSEERLMENTESMMLAIMYKYQ